jgi:hypothetical protein
LPPTVYFFYRYPGCFGNIFRANPVSFSSFTYFFIGGAFVFAQPLAYLFAQSRAGANGYFVCTVTSDSGIRTLSSSSGIRALATRYSACGRASSGGASSRVFEYIAQNTNNSFDWEPCRTFYFANQDTINAFVNRPGALPEHPSYSFIHRRNTSSGPYGNFFFAVFTEVNYFSGAGQLASINSPIAPVNIACYTTRTKDNAKNRTRVFPDLPGQRQYVFDVVYWGE